MNDLMETGKMVAETSPKLAIAWEFNEKIIRTVQIDGEPWWVAKDVCDVLGLSNPTVVVDRLDSDERSKFDLGRQGEVNIINESGLYALILRSNKPTAKVFRKWVTSEVLPQIRKTGGYMSGSEYQNLSKKLVELEKRVQLIGQPTATVNNEQRLLAPLVKLFLETKTVYENNESSIADLIKETFEYLSTPDSFGSSRAINEYTHNKIMNTDFLEDQGILIARDRLYKDTFMIWLCIDSCFISSAYRNTEFESKWDRVLLNIPSVHYAKNMRFNGRNHAAVGIPVSLFLTHLA